MFTNNPYGPPPGLYQTPQQNPLSQQLSAMYSQLLQQQQMQQAQQQAQMQQQMQAQQPQPIGGYPMNSPAPVSNPQPQLGEGRATTNPTGPSLSDLKTYAQTVYPNDPVRQQLALSQAILESGAPGHMSNLATQNNNYFGIKSGNIAPGTANNINAQTSEFNGQGPISTTATFAGNQTPVDSFMQHKNLLENSKRYAPVMNANDIQDAITAMGNSGYATDPSYAQKLRSVWTKYVKGLYY